MTSSYVYREKHALIIGINDYRRDSLKYCINDAEDLASALQRINFKVSFWRNCNHREFYNLIETFSKTIQSTDLVLFYFAGHGKQNEKENFMLPSDYDYDYRGDEQDYIVNHGVKVNYLIKKIDNRNRRTAIYLFDCCRSSIKTRSTNANQGLSSMDATSHGFIVYACAPGKGVQDETRNDRNGSFMENLLKHISIPNKHIEDIMQDVAHAVHLQTGDYQLPYRSSSLVNKVFLLTDDNQVETTRSRDSDVRSTQTNTRKNSTSKDRPAHHDIDTSKNTSDLRRQSSEPFTCNSTVNVTPLNLQSTRSNGKNDKSRFPPVKCPMTPVSKKEIPSDRTVRLTKIKPSHARPSDGLQTLRPVTVNDCRISLESPNSDRLLSSRPRRLRENYTSRNSNSQKMCYSELCDNQEHAYSSDGSWVSEHDGDSDIDNDILQKFSKSFQTSRHNSESNSGDQQSVHDDFTNYSDDDLKRCPASSSRPTSVEIGDETSDLSLPSSDKTKVLTVCIRSLCRNDRVEISVNTTMKGLINIIWHEVKFDMERYTKDSHILLLFNHRLHIFVDSDLNALVKDFLLLSPPSQRPTSASIDFYVYGLPLGSVSSMYNFDDDYATLFGNPKSWCPAYFADYEQLERSQSILLSSLYALRLYFRTATQELKAERLAMEAQFFLQLRKYLFPPAILAFRHAIVGSMFWFEKMLLVDALIQLLTRLCNPEAIDKMEICDFIPLLFCWLLEKCDANEQTEDCFVEVKLTNGNRRGCSYFQNPVTTSASKRKALLLEEFDVTQDHDVLQYHVDIRSLTLYLTRTTKTSDSYTCKCEHYIIYDPSIQDAPVLESLAYWTEFDMKDLFKTIARTPEYRSLSIITRDAVNADVKNQLVLLDENRTVALLFSRKTIMHSNEKTPRDVDHLFDIFDPLKCTKETPSLAVSSSAFQKDISDPRLPIYFNDSLKITETIISSSLDDGSSSPAYQVTVILLDRSRSMLDYRIVSSDKTVNPTHADICKIMLGRLSDNVLSTNDIHAFGLIEFATKYKTICQITRSREQFEKALAYDAGIGEWTCMYDAIGEAIRQIKTFSDSPIRAINGCKKLIICLSDGINNRGSTTIDNLRELVKKHNIVIDFISFIRDDQLKNEKEVTKTREFRKLCTDSSGYIYQNLHVLSDIELASVFEQEAAIWLSKRSKKSCGLIDKPERYISPNFEQKARHQLPSNSNVQNLSSSRRILKELQAMLSNPSNDVIIFAVPNNIAFWKVVLKGPANTPYQRKFWMLYVEFDSHYPNCAPDARFITPIYHVNISGDGKICHPIFGRRWSQQTKMQVVFENILDLLKKPNFDDAMSLQKAHLYKENPEDYRKQAEEHAKKYAKSDIKSLKHEYQLED